MRSFSFVFWTFYELSGLFIQRLEYLMLSVSLGGRGNEEEGREERGLREEESFDPGIRTPGRHAKRRQNEIWMREVQMWWLCVNGERKRERDR